MKDIAELANCKTKGITVSITVECRIYFNTKRE